MTTAWPLDWPSGWPRTPWQQQRAPYSRFGNLTMHKATQRLLRALDLLGATDVVLSTDIPVRRDGLPYSRMRWEDPGAAVYFRRKGRQLCMAHDVWSRPEANVNALALAIEGLRQMERHGGGAMLERAFHGFVALEAPLAWWEVLKLPRGAPKETIKARYRDLAREHHPDKGGSIDAFERVKAAYEEGMRA